MQKTRNPWWARALVGLVGASLLGAPCGQGGTPTARTFAAGSIVIPMDNCYQRRDNTTTVNTLNCEGTGDVGIFRAYGLVYLMIKHGVPVYWAISPDKTSTTGTDFSVTVTSSPVLKKWSWANNAFQNPASAQTSVNYLGGPFVVDSTDAATVRNWLSSSCAGGAAVCDDFAPFRTERVVNLHEVQAGFTAASVRPLAGIPPKIAIVAVPSSFPGVMAGYLTLAGLDQVANAEGTASANPTGCDGRFDPTGLPLRGEIYDQLCESDFLSSGGNPAPLLANDYKLLWAPHWDYSSSTSTNFNAVMTSIESFVDQGNNLFAECSSITSLEGGPDGWGTKSGFAATHFQSTAKFLGYNGENGASGSSVGWNSGWSSATDHIALFPDPNVQLAEFQFSLDTGWLESWSPDGAAPPQSVYRTGVERFIWRDAIAPEPAWDVYTRIRKDGDTNKGFVVYMGGHDYSDADGTASHTAGARLILNTLFNLGIPCIDPNSACATGQLGVCGVGTLKCSAGGGAYECVPTVQPGAVVETCDGLDNDCDGLVDEDATDVALWRTCYSGAQGTDAPGRPCHGGIQTCVNGAWSVCQGEVVPVAEACNGADDNCDGVEDDFTRACYDGPPGTEANSPCHAGTQRCLVGQWGACANQALPLPEICDTVDNDCDGTPDNGVCTCTDGQTQPCYTGPSGTSGKGLCHDGHRDCVGGAWGLCLDEVVPTTEVCNGEDDNCDGVNVDEGGVCAACNPGDSRACYDGSAETRGQGVCVDGTQTCTAGEWGSCSGQTLPGLEACDGKDNDCDGTADDGATCPANQVCVNGVCVPTRCGGEISRCPDGYSCVAGSGCQPVNCPTVPCPAGQLCASGACSDPCAGVTCGQGAVCSAGTCVGGGCLSTGCDTGMMCLLGLCVDDPCAAASCPAGTFCRAGDCVQSCAYVTCPSGQACGVDGVCAAVPSCSPACGAGEICTATGCQADPCAGKSCGQGQVCQAGRCVDDPCTGVACGIGTCAFGQCQFAQADKYVVTDAGLVATSEDGGSPDDSGGVGVKPGCGCQGGSGGALALFGALPLGLLRRRRRAARVPVRKSVAFAAGLLAAALLGACGSDTAPAPPGPGDDGGVVPPVTCDNGLSSCGIGCVDFTTSNLHCGVCGRGCAAGFTCQASDCAYVSQNPVLTSMDPQAAALGGSISISLTGERFASGAVLRLAGGGLDGERALTVDSATQATLPSLDLAGAAPGKVLVRVVNPGRMISNSLELTLAGTIQAPVLTGIQPTNARVGAPVTILAAGHYFLSGTVLVAAPVGTAGVALPTTMRSDSLLEGVLDLTSATAGQYEIFARSGAQESNHLRFDATAVNALVTSAIPSAVPAGWVGSLTVQGSGFEPGTLVRISGSGAWSPKDFQAVVIGATQLFVASCDLSAVPSGTHELSAVSGGTQTNTLPFQVLSARPQLSTRTPDRAMRGAQVTIALVGAGFDPTSLAMLAPGSAAPVALTTTFTDGGHLSASVDLMGWPAGNYTLFVRNQGALDSNALSFRVDPNEPALASVSPGWGRQDETVNLTVSGTGFQAGAKVWISSATMAEVELMSSVVDSTTLTVTNLGLAAYPVGSYMIVARNPLSPPSAGVGFLVREGMAVVQSISPNAASAGTTGFTANLTGTYFYPTSSVHVSGGTITDSPLPTTYVDPTTLAVTTDLTGVATGTYQVTVVNPGPLVSATSADFTVN